MKILLLPLILFPVLSFCQLNADGWTILDPSTVDKIVYVSSTSGNDSLAAAYTYPNDLIGDDPRSPIDIIAFETVDAAMQTVGNFESTWILFKTGDVFATGLEARSGLNEDSPMVYSYYGAHTSPPLFKTGKKRGINFCCNELENFWVIGLHFYAHTRDPDSPDFEGFDGGANGIRIYTSTPYSNVLIEGCSFRFYKGSTFQGPNELGGFSFRRNLVLDSYSADSHSSGFFSSKPNGFFMVENIFDHNGWYKQSIDLNNQEEGMATIFNHNTYFSNTSNSVFKDNGFYRPSSIGTKWISSHEGKSFNVRIENNLYHDCEVGMSIGGNDLTDPYRFQDFVVTGNVITSAGKSRPTARNLGWGINIVDWNGGVVKENYLLHQQQEDITNVYAFSLNQWNKDVTIEDNVIYGMKNADIFQLTNTVLDSITIKNNEITFLSNPNRYLVEMDAAYTVDFKDNAFYAEDEITNPFKVSGATYDLEDWNSTFGQDTIVVGDVDYLDPSRTLETYASEVLGHDDLDEFYEALREQNIFNWKPEFTTPVIIEWIKNGYKKMVSSSTSNLDDNEGDIYPNPAVDWLFINAEKIVLIKLLQTSGAVYPIRLSKGWNTIENVPQGFYTVIIESENRKVEAIPLVVIK